MVYYQLSYLSEEIFWLWTTLLDKKIHFQIGDLVWKIVLPGDTKTRGFGKLSPNWEGPFIIEKILSK